MNKDEKKKVSWKTVAQHLLQFTSIEARLVKKLAKVIVCIFNIADSEDRSTIISTLSVLEDVLRKQEVEHDVKSDSV